MATPTNPAALLLADIAPGYIGDWSCPRTGFAVTVEVSSAYYDDETETYLVDVSIVIDMWGSHEGDESERVSFDAADTIARAHALFTAHDIDVAGLN